MAVAAVETKRRRASGQHCATCRCALLSRSPAGRDTESDPDSYSTHYGDEPRSRKRPRVQAFADDEGDGDEREEYEGEEGEEGVEEVEENQQGVENDDDHGGGARSQETVEVSGAEAHTSCAKSGTGVPDEGPSRRDLGDNLVQSPGDHPGEVLTGRFRSYGSDSARPDCSRPEPPRRRQPLQSNGCADEHPSSCSPGDSNAGLGTAATTDVAVVGVADIDDDDNDSHIVVDRGEAIDHALTTNTGSSSTTRRTTTNSTQDVMTSTTTTAASSQASPSPPLSSPLTLHTPESAPADEERLASRAASRGTTLPSPRTIVSWTMHAQSATVHGVIQTLQAWMRVARDQQQQQQQSELLLHPLEVPELILPSASPMSRDDLTLAVRTFRICERATAIGSQAVLCRRLCYANLFRLNERAREQSVRGFGSRSQLFALCYPEFANPDTSLENLTTDGRTALNRLSRDIHFGGTICRFADRYSCPEAALLLQPAIPDRFLRKLTAIQLDLWADMVCRVARPSIHVLHCLWKGVAMIVNQTIDLRSYGFPFERVRFDGSRYVDVETNRPVKACVEDLLTPVPLGSLCHVSLTTSRPFRASIGQLLTSPAGDVSGPFITSIPQEPSSDERESLEMEVLFAVDSATDSHGLGWNGCAVEQPMENDGRQKLRGLELPSTAFDGLDIWDEDDELYRALGHISSGIANAPVEN